VKPRYTRRGNDVYEDLPGPHLIRVNRSWPIVRRIDQLERELAHVRGQLEHLYRAAAGDDGKGQQ
jgi:hypothetical protein